MRATVLMFVIAGFASGGAWGQEQPTPKTKLETFMAQDGVVIVQGFSTVGSAKGIYGSSVTVDAKEMTNASSGSKQLGITVQVKEGGTVTRDHTSYVDLDEIDSLLSGLEYLGKIDSTVTTLSEFQVDYRTRGDLLVSVFSSKGKRNVAVRSGTIGASTAYFEFPSLEQIRALVVDAKVNLAALK